MLVFSRKQGQEFVVPTHGLTVTVLRIKGNQVRLGISAPAGVAVHRKEVWQQIRRGQNGAALMDQPATL